MEFNFKNYNILKCEDFFNNCKDICFEVALSDVSSTGIARLKQELCIAKSIKEDRSIIVNLSGMDKSQLITSETNMLSYLIKILKAVEISNKDYVQLSENFYSKYLIRNELNKLGIKYFCSKKAYTDDEVNYYVATGASIVMIGGELGFKIPYISRYLKRSGIKLSVCVNKYDFSQNIQAEDIPFLIGFFIRPEDLHLYENMIDFVCFDFGGVDQQKTLYEIYSSEKWHGHLDEIITHFPMKIHSDTIYNMFGYDRFKCGKKCSFEKKCRTCYRMIDFAQRQEKTGIKINNL